MANNNSVSGGEPLRRKNNYRVVIVHVLVVIFLCVNLLLILTFFSKDLFYTTMRYIFFAVTLLSDSFLLIISDILLVLSYFQVTMQLGYCVVIYIILSLYFFVTPITLTAMTLERYVAICMPLRHGELCSTDGVLHCILIIHGISAVPCMVVISMFFASASQNVYTQYRICSGDMFVFLRWQDNIKFAVFQFYFLIMSVTIISSYIRIGKVAKAASGENKKSTWKGLRTVLLHAFQLLLCLIQLWCPFIEAAAFRVDLTLYNEVRYFNYITFTIVSRCLSPLIYGLRDEPFFRALKYNALVLLS